MLPRLAQRLSFSARRIQRISSSTGVSPGIPPAHEFHLDMPQALDVKLPDMSIREAEEPVQIPFVPDFWSSSTPSQEQVPIPKVLLVAGADVAATNALNTEAQVEEYISPKPLGEGGFWDDAAESLGLPYPKQVSSAFLEAYKTFKNTLK